MRLGLLLQTKRVIRTDAGSARYGGSIGDPVTARSERARTEQGRKVQDRLIRELRRMKVPRSERDRARRIVVQAGRTVDRSGGRRYSRNYTSSVFESAKRKLGRLSVHGKSLNEPLLDTIELMTYDEETKAIRRVRTPEGARQYGQPIGSVIRPDPGFGTPLVFRPTPRNRPARSFKPGQRIAFVEDGRVVSGVVVDRQLADGGGPDPDNLIVRGLPFNDRRVVRRQDVVWQAGDGKPMPKVEDAPHRSERLAPMPPSTAGDETRAAELVAERFEAGESSESLVAAMTDGEFRATIELLGPDSAEARRVHEWRTGETLDPDDSAGRSSDLDARVSDALGESISGVDVEEVNDDGTTAISYWNVEGDRVRTNVPSSLLTDDNDRLPPSTAGDETPKWKLSAGGDGVEAEWRDLKLSVSEVITSDDESELHWEVRDADGELVDDGYLKPREHGGGRAAVAFAREEALRSAKLSKRSSYGYGLGPMPPSTAGDARSVTEADVERHARLRYRHVGGGEGRMGNGRNIAESYAVADLVQERFAVGDEILLTGRVGGSERRGRILEMNRTELVLDQNGTRVPHRWQHVGSVRSAPAERPMPPSATSPRDLATEEERLAVIKATPYKGAMRAGYFQDGAFDALAGKPSRNEKPKTEVAGTANSIAYDKGYTFGAGLRKKNPSGGVAQPTPDQAKKIAKRKAAAKFYAKKKGADEERAKAAAAEYERRSNEKGEALPVTPFLEKFLKGDPAPKVKPKAAAASADKPKLTKVDEGHYAAFDVDGSLLGYVSRNDPAPGGPTTPTWGWIAEPDTLGTGGGYSSRQAALDALTRVHKETSAFGGAAVAIGDGRYRTVRYAKTEEAAVEATNRSLRSRGKRVKPGSTRWSLHPRKDSSTLEFEVEDAPTPGPSVEALLDVLRASPSATDVMSDEDRAKRPRSTAKAFYTLYEREDGSVHLDFSPSATDNAKRQAVIDELRKTGWELELQRWNVDDDEVLPTDATGVDVVIIATPQVHAARRAKRQEEIRRSESKTDDELKAELAWLREALNDMGREEGYDLGLEAIPMDRLHDELRYSERHNSPTVTVKIPSYSELDMSRAMARRLLGLPLKRSEAKMRPFALGLEVKKRRVRRVRSAEGARRYGQPIGSIIRLDANGKPIRAGGGDAPEAARERQERRERATARDRAADAAEKDKPSLSDREKLAKLNARRKAQGKPPLAKLPKAKDKVREGNVNRFGKPMDLLQERAERLKADPEYKARYDAAFEFVSQPVKAPYDQADPRRQNPDYAEYVDDLNVRLAHAMADPGPFGTTADGSLTPEGYAAVEKLVKDELDAIAERGVPRDREVIFAAGISGAGKTTMLKSQAAREAAGVDYPDGAEAPSNYAVANADDFKTRALSMLPPEYLELGINPEESTALTHEVSSVANKLYLAELQREGYNTIVDGTFEGKMTKREAEINSFRTAGFKVTALLVDGDLETSLQRATQRHTRDADLDDGVELPPTGGYQGRYVPLGQVVVNEQAPDDRRPQGRTMWGAERFKSANAQNFQSSIEAGFFDSWTVFDSNQRVVADGGPRRTVPPGAVIPETEDEE